MSAPDDFAAQRARMVRDQLLGRGIDEPRVLRALQAVPRERFVPAPLQSDAYADRALGIGLGQSISQPYIVARSCALARIEPDARILEVGAGSGYQAAVLAQLGKHVTGLELLKPLADRARDTLAALGIDNASIVWADGTLGYPPGAPYDAILVAAAAPRVPDALLSQLADGGRLVMPVGTAGLQELSVITRHGDDFVQESHDACVFVPLRGRDGVDGSADQ